MTTTADARGFLVAFPQGIGQSWNAGDCCGQATATNVDDMGFFDAIVAHLEATVCVDVKRVYAAGFSNGGFFAHRLGCERSGVVAAIAPVSGVMGMPPDQCKPTRAVPVLEFHGDADIVVPYVGGTPVANGLNFGPFVPTFRSVAETNQAWRDKDDCLGAGDVVLHQGDATCTNWKGIAGSEVELCTIAGGGHSWPGGQSLGMFGEGKVSSSVSASDRMADFFARHALP
jgi:polyhydroxybutyrate depolymerase